MRKMSTLTTSGLLAAIYKELQQATMMERGQTLAKDAPDLRLAQAVGVKLEPLSKSALQWLQKKDGALLLEDRLILGALREMNLLLLLDEEQDCVLGKSSIEVSATFLADERREGRGEVEFLRLTVLVYTTPDLLAKYNNRLRQAARGALEAARVYLRRESSQYSLYV